MLPKVHQPFVWPCGQAALSNVADKARSIPQPTASPMGESVAAPAGYWWCVLAWLDLFRGLLATFTPFIVRLSLCVSGSGKRVPEELATSRVCPLWPCSSCALLAGPQVRKGSQATGTPGVLALRLAWQGLPT